MVLMVEYGIPMLSMMLSSSYSGISRRIAVSTRSASRAVSSMRVPVLARRCRMNWPLSLVGKKFSPSHGSSSHASRHTARNAPMKTPCRESSRISSPR